VQVGDLHTTLQQGRHGPAHIAFTRIQLVRLCQQCGSASAQPGRAAVETWGGSPVHLGGGILDLYLPVLQVMNHPLQLLPSGRQLLAQVQAAGLLLPQRLHG
jgi:hypothetical protein